MGPDLTGRTISDVIQVVVELKAAFYKHADVNLQFSVTVDGNDGDTSRNKKLQSNDS